MILAFTMLQLRKLLTERAEWFERALASLAHLDGYGDLPQPVVQICRFVGKEPVRMSVLAEHLGVSRQRVAQVASEGCALGILALSDDPDDGRVKRVGFSEEGWEVVRMAVARMTQIENELARRIGKRNLEQLVELLGADWGPPTFGKGAIEAAEKPALRGAGALQVDSRRHLE